MPGVEVEFDIDIDAEEIQSIADEWPEHRRAILYALAEDLVGNIYREIPVNTERARSTVRTQERSGQITVVAGGEKGVDYIRPLLDGTEPHAPGRPDPEANPSLARWARRNEYPGGFEAIYWSIYHYGTKPHDFVTEPVEDTQDDAGDIATLVLRNRGVFE